MLHDILTNPATLSFAGVILAMLVWPWLEKLVKKTPTMADDEFLAAVESIVNGALAKKKAGRPPATTNITDQP